MPKQQTGWISVLARLTLELRGRCRVPHDSTAARRSGPLARIVSHDLPQGNGTQPPEVQNEAQRTPRPQSRGRCVWLKAKPFATKHAATDRTRGRQRCAIGVAWEVVREAKGFRR